MTIVYEEYSHDPHITSYATIIGMLNFVNNVRLVTTRFNKTNYMENNSIDLNN